MFGGLFQTRAFWIGVWSIVTVNWFGDLVFHHDDQLDASNPWNWIALVVFILIIIHELRQFVRGRPF